MKEAKIGSNYFDRSILNKHFKQHSKTVNLENIISSFIASISLQSLILERILNAEILVDGNLNCLILV